MTQPANNRTLNEYASYRFSVEIASITAAFFDECSGLNSEIDVQEIVEGGRNDYVHMLPGRIKSPMPRLVLKRGLGAPELWTWYSDVLQGKIQRHNISIVLYGYVGMTDVRWNVLGALPVKWSGPTLKADSTEVAFETIELIHRGFNRVA